MIDNGHALRLTWRDKFVILGSVVWGGAVATALVLKDVWNDL